MNMTSYTHVKSPIFIQCSQRRLNCLCYHIHRPNPSVDHKRRVVTPSEHVVPKAQRYKWKCDPNTPQNGEEGMLCALKDCRVALDCQCFTNPDDNWKYEDCYVHTLTRSWLNIKQTATKSNSERRSKEIALSERCEERHTVIWQPWVADCVVAALGIFEVHCVLPTTAVAVAVSEGMLYAIFWLLGLGNIPHYLSTASSLTGTFVILAGMGEAVNTLPSLGTHLIGQWIESNEYSVMRQ